MTTAPPQRRDGPGHVFVVHGRLELLVSDAVLVPTDARFGVARGWSAVVGDRPRRPDRWGEPGARWGQGDERVWYLDVGAFGGPGVEGLADVVTGALEEMAEIDPRPSSRRGAARRVRPLLAVPVVGIRRGGFSAERGAVVRRLLELTHDVARRRGVDIAVVTDDAAVHGALQHERRRVDAERGGVWVLPPQLDRLARDLAKKARDGGLALFLGAGASVPAGLPMWGQLLDDVRQRAQADPVLHGDSFTRLDPLDQAQLLRARVPGFDREVVAACATERHGVGHALLAALGCAAAVTTNFDHCYELAHRAVERPGGSVVAVLPHEVPAGRSPWLLKMHGDVSRPASIVLSRQDFALYDATSRPAAAVLQSLLLTRHLLVVGASLTDDNVLRLTHEVAAFRRSHEVGGAHGSVLDVDDVPVRGALWDGELDWFAVPGADVPERARLVEVFLDALAARATTDASWLLDERFEALLPEAEQRLAAEVRMLRRRLPAGEGPWSELAALLDDRGGAPSGGDPPAR